MNNHRRFYKTKWFMWFCLIVFPPVGLVLLWVLNKDIKGIIKIILTIIFGTWFAFLLLFTLVEPSPTTSNNNIESTVKSQITETTTKKRVAVKKTTIKQTVKKQTIEKQATEKEVSKTKNTVPINFKIKYEEGPNCTKDFNVYVDNLKICELNRGEQQECTVELTEGEHKLICYDKKSKEKNNFCIIECKKGKTIEMEFDVSYDKISFVDLSESKESVLDDYSNEVICNETPLIWNVNEIYEVGNIKFKINKIDITSIHTNNVYANYVRLHCDILKGNYKNLSMHKDNFVIGKVTLPDKTYGCPTDTKQMNITWNVDGAFDNKDDKRFNASSISIQNDSNNDVLMQGIFFTTKQLKHNDDFVLDLYFYNENNQLTVTFNNQE